MKKFFFLLLVLLLIALPNLYATKGINSSDIMENYSGENVIISGGNNSNNELSEEIASVNKSNVESNYKVETPTIVLLSVFGVLVLISLILIVFKI